MRVCGHLPSFYQGRRSLYLVGLLYGARARDVGWRIDYFFVTENLLPKLKKAFILKDVMGSDHCPVGIELT